MLNTVLFDMGGTLEDIWYNDETITDVMVKVRAVLEREGLDPACSQEEFRERVLAGVKDYKRWSEGNMLEDKPENIWPNYYLKSFGFDREKLRPITEELANLWEITHYHRELRPGVKDMLEGLRRRGYHIGVISNNASLYNVFNVLEDYGIRDYMEDVTVSSITGYRKPHPEIFRISMRQMRCKPENCVYVGDTVSRDIIGSKRAGFGRAVQIWSHLSAQKDAGVEIAPNERPDVVIHGFDNFLNWLDGENPAMALA
ncbi:MAG: HAD-IIIA family hydrolase [Oscillibacter sp.]|nr:HAD-IIIA family hydrolase [Oscillibacter sp.]